MDASTFLPTSPSPSTTSTTTKTTTVKGDGSTETTIKTTTGTGTITEYVPGTTFIMKEVTGPVTYLYGKTVAYVTKSGKVITQEDVQAAFIDRCRRLVAAAVFAAPGLIGAAIMLALFRNIFPEWDPVSLGRYGAFILVGDALLAGMALDRAKKAVSRAR